MNSRATVCGSGLRNLSRFGQWSLFQPGVVSAGWFHTFL
jgi:hypothetical protein